MKKVILLFIAGFILAACEPLKEDLTTKQIYYITVKASEWVELSDINGLNKYFSASANIRGLNNTVFEKGAVMAYVDYGDTQQALPYIRHFENTKGERWTRTIDFDYARGKINFYITYSDFSLDAPEAMNFKVVLIW